MQLPKLYEPAAYESDIYALWEKSDAFKPTHRGNKETYSIVIPPPNANGNLHLGHALTLGIEDIAIRYHRMTGKSTVFIPGADHAGFETQSVYEKQLTKEGKSRFDFTREELYSQILEFVSNTKESYETQFRQVGASLDWSRYTFSLDDKVVAQAYGTFKKMWDDNLIYRGTRLVNFCTVHGTGFADIEVEHEEVKGKIWHITYPLTDGSGEVVVATTRPETMLGDTAVAVHPEDERYANYLGKTIKLPLTNREIPIIADEFVDREFGTGAVKLTPAHDQNDYDASERHDLPKISVITHEGKIAHDTPEAYRGMDVASARKAIVSDLESLGLLVKTEDHAHNVGHCYKCGSVLEPLLREQWFIDMKPLAAKAIKAIRDDSITFYPESKKDVLITYYKNLRDWNISRQIAWGIPIPAFQNLDNPDDWIYDERVSEEVITVDGKTYRRDPDVFDTWFSSSSWPYATLDYPKGTDFDDFYPLSLMETGFDILQPWVSRMIIFGLYITGKIPFERVYLHGLILDEKGAKMSKSKGNVINPIEKIEQYGSDAVRMGLISGQRPGSNQPFSEAKLVGARNFCNKLWNVARYVEAKLPEDYTHPDKPKLTSSTDEWMMYKLQHSIKAVTELLEQYRFAEASDHVYQLLWNDFADWYIEASKTNLNPEMLGYSLETILKLAHPFAPFVTETIWQTLYTNKDTLLITASWPKAHKSDHKKAEAFESIKDLITEIRFIKATLGMTGVHLTLYHKGEEAIENHTKVIQQLARLIAVKEVNDGQGLHLTSGSFDCWLDIDQESARAFIAQLKKLTEEQATRVGQLEARLANKSYVDKAPKALVDQTKDELAEAKARLEKMQQEVTRFSR